MQVPLKNISKFYTKVVQRLRTTLSFAQYFTMLFIRLILCRLHNFQLFGFSFKIRIIFVKLLRSYFFDFAILFYQVRVKKLGIRFLGVKRRITAHLGVSSARLGHGHGRACSPPICTILRRLIKLVCALLRFRERPRTIEVRVSTLSPQTCTKSLAQYSVVLFIQSVLYRQHFINFSYLALRLA